MKLEEYSSLERAWSQLSLALARYKASQTTDAGQALLKAQDDVKAALLAVASHLAESGKQAEARKMLAIMRDVATQFAAVLSAQAALDASFKVDPKINIFGTFLSSMKVAETIDQFEKQISALQEQAASIFLGLC